MDRLIDHSADHTTSLEISKDRKTIGIFRWKSGSRLEEGGKIAEFDIQLVWDIIRDAVATANVNPNASPGLFRRKGEAMAAILYTHELQIKEFRMRKE